MASCIPSLKRSIAAARREWEAEEDEEDEEEEEEEEAVNRRVRTFAGVVKESLARVGRAASAGDVDAEVAALINRLRRLAAER